MMEGRVCKEAAERLKVQCVYFARRVLEAQANGGKMLEKNSTIKAVLGIIPSVDHAPQVQVIDIVFAAAPDMLDAASEPAEKWR